VGLRQYQCVLPDSAGPDAVRNLMARLTKSGGASFLCVIKDCGDEGHGLLSWPKRGVSIALDMPVRDNTQQLVDDLNEFVVAHGGRVYLAKDAYTRPEHFRAMEPRLAAFRSRAAPMGSERHDSERAVHPPVWRSSMNAVVFRRDQRHRPRRGARVGGTRRLDCFCWAATTTICSAAPPIWTFDAGTPRSAGTASLRLVRSGDLWPGVVRRQGRTRRNRHHRRDGGGVRDASGARSGFASAHMRCSPANFTNTVVFCEEARRYLLPRGGTLCVFSSVAGERGRKPSFCTAPPRRDCRAISKGSTTNSAPAGLKVVCVKPGFVKNVDDRRPQNRHPFAGTPEQVARIRRKGHRSRHACRLRPRHLAPRHARDSACFRARSCAGSSSRGGPNL
jgi:NAD(P)-dependent dehydrogenase (short-subunit alcohol dehydrogenase family)